VREADRDGTAAGCGDGDGALSIVYCLVSLERTVGKVVLDSFCERGDDDSLLPPCEKEASDDEE
jgi:hypothetical protein